MNEKFVDGFFKEYFDLGSRFKERFTQQFNRTDELNDANHKLTLEVKIFRDKIDELQTKVEKLEEKVEDKDYLANSYKEELEFKTEELEHEKWSYTELEKRSNAKSLEIRRLEN